MVSGKGRELVNLTSVFKDCLFCVIFPPRPPSFNSRTAAEVEFRGTDDLFAAYMVSPAALLSYFSTLKGR